MSIFQITPLVPESAPLEQTIATAIAEHDKYKMKNGGWLLKYDGTSKELAEKLGILNDPPVIASCFIVAISAYHGRAPSDMWEWIVSRWK